jgi:PKD repeat protein
VLKAALRRLPVTGAGLLLALAMVLAAQSAASAAPVAVAPAAPATAAGEPATVSADALPTVQINGVVWAQAIVGNTVYATGSFSKARPAGSPVGKNEVARSGILAYNITTGALITSFKHTLNAAGHSLSVSTDGKRLYVGGAFTSIDGRPHAHLAAFDTRTGALVPSFAPTVNGNVLAISSSVGGVYFGGTFTKVNGVARSHLALVSAKNGALSAWKGSASATVTALAFAPDHRTLVVGGHFSVLSGQTRYGLGGVALSTGAATAWDMTSPIRDYGTSSAITSLVSDGRQIYLAGYAFNHHGNFEGTAAINSTGTVQWMNSCHGDTYSVVPIGSVLYSASHAHDCSDVNGWNETSPRAWHRALASTTYPGQNCHLNTNNGSNYPNFAGRPCATLLDWYPQISPGTISGVDQGAWSVTGNRQYISLGGEFPAVNGTAQQGLVRFAIRSIAPNKSAPLSAASLVPTATSTQRGQARVQWQTTWDRDDADLTYSLFRDGGTTPIYTVTRTSRFWDLPYLSYTDTGLTPGSTHTYRIGVTDPYGNSITVAKGPAVVVQTTPTAPDPYGAAVLADGPSAYYRLEDADASSALDATGAAPATVAGGISAGAASPVAGYGRTAMATTGDGSVIGPVVGAPEILSAELWFSTTSQQAATLLGFVAASGGTHDREITMTATGQLGFNAIGATRVGITSTRSYNDGSWHHVVATASAAGTSLYVDGGLVATSSSSPGLQYSGRWTIGGGASAGFTGALAEVAIYPSVLSSGQIAAHFAASPSVTPPTNTAPTATFTQQSNGLQLSVDGSGSTDSDGFVSAYQWDFGDGTTGTGAGATHVYSAAGTYSVTLTVTDNAGATATQTASVTVDNPVLLAGDDFARTTTSGWGTADHGGSYTGTTGTATSVSGGSGSLTVTPGASTSAYLTGIASSDTDLSMTLTTSTAPTGAGLTISAVGRRVAGAGSYRARVRLLTNGNVDLTLVRATDSGVETPISDPVVVSGLSAAAGSAYKIRLQVTGTAPTLVRAKVWDAAANEPAYWTVSTTDATDGMQTTGYLGVTGYQSASGDATSVSVSALRAWVASSLPE